MNRWSTSCDTNRHSQSLSPYIQCKIEMSSHKKPGTLLSISPGCQDPEKDALSFRHVIKLSVAFPKDTCKHLFEGLHRYCKDTNDCSVECHGLISISLLTHMSSRVTVSHISCGYTKYKYMYRNAGKGGGFGVTLWPIMNAALRALLRPLYLCRRTTAIVREKGVMGNNIFILV